MSVIKSNVELSSSAIASIFEADETVSYLCFALARYCVWQMNNTNQIQINDSSVTEYMSEFCAHAKDNDDVPQISGSLTEKLFEYLQNGIVSKDYPGSVIETRFIHYQCHSGGAFPYFKTIKGEFVPLGSSTMRTTRKLALSLVPNAHKLKMNVLMAPIRHGKHQIVFG